jgi:hypothetical protein
VAVSIGNLVGTLSLDDTLTGGLMKAGTDIRTFLEGTIGQIIELGKQGSTVSDVADNFDQLASAAGESADVMLSALARGVDGTISNFDLMRQANEAMGAGLVATSADFETLGAASKLLADRTGGDTAGAFDTLTTAMATGRTAALKHFGVMVDSSKAVDTYKKANNLLTGELTQTQKAEALRAETMKVLRGELEKFGKPAEDFADKIESMEVRWTNFMDSLAVMVSDSPAVTAAIDGIGEILNELMTTLEGNTDAIMSFVKGGLVVFLGALTAGGVIITGTIRLFRELLTATLSAGAGFQSATAAVAGFGAVVAQRAGLDDLAAKLRTSAQNASENATKLTEMANKVDVGLGVAEDAAAKMTVAMFNLTGKVAESDAVAGKSSKTHKQFAKDVADVGVSSVDATKQLKAQVDAMEAFFDSLAKKRSEREGRESMRDSFLGQFGPTADEATAAANRMVIAFEEITSAGKATDQQLVQFIQSLEKQIELGATTDDVFNALAAAMQEAANRGPAVGEAIGFVSKKAEDGQKAFDKFGQGIQGSIAKLIAGKEASMSFGETLGRSLTSALEKLPNVVMNALQGGGDLFKSVGSLFGNSLGESVGKSLSKSIGGTLGKTLGAAMPGIGSILGSIGGGLIDKILGGGEGAKVNDMRDKFVAAQGGLAALGQKAKEVGLDLSELLRAKKVTDFEAAVKKLNLAWDEQKQKQQDLLTAQSEVNAAMERYGITVGEMGPKWQQQDMDGKTAQLLKDVQLLNAAQADHTAMIEKMGPAFQDVVTQARATGATIPEALRPMIEEMIKSGKILDENGEAFESVEDAGLSFAQTVSEAVQSVADQVKRLVDALLGVGNLNIPPVRIPVEVDGPAGTGHHPDTGSFPHMAEGGMVTQPTFALIGERGPEVVTPLDTLREMLREQASSTMLRAEFKLGEKTLVDAMGQLVRDNKFGARSRIRG